MTKYFDMDGNKIFEEDVSYARLFSVNQTLVNNSIRYECKGCAWDGKDMYVNIEQTA